MVGCRSLIVCPDARSENGNRENDVGGFLSLGFLALDPIMVSTLRRRRGSHHACPGAARNVERQTDKNVVALRIRTTLISAQ